MKSIICLFQTYPLKKINQENPPFRVNRNRYVAQNLLHGQAGDPYYFFSLQKMMCAMVKTCVSGFLPLYLYTNNRLIIATFSLAYTHSRLSVYERINISQRTTSGCGHSILRGRCVILTYADMLSSGVELILSQAVLVVSTIFSYFK